MTQSNGNFFEDFSLGQTLIHGVPRTITAGDAALYLGLTGSRYALHCAETVATSVGFKTMPLDNLLVFHIAFGKTVNDISLNAVANLGYAEVFFETPCYSGDTLSVTSDVIGLKENSNGKTGVVYVHSIAKNQQQETVVSWKRWVMVHKRTDAKLSQATLPSLEPQVDFEQQKLPDSVNFNEWQVHYSDSQAKFSELNEGEKIFHRDGITINDSDHSIATRLYQNNARVHFDQFMMNDTPHGKRLVYGGHIISLCRALSYNGLANAVWLSAINAGTHCNPSFAGDTIFCQSEIISKQTIEGRDDLGLVRIRMLGLKNNTPDKIGELYQQENSRTRYHANVVLDLDYTAMVIK